MSEGQEVCVLEAMKMQNSMAAAKTGVVSVVFLWFQSSDPLSINGYSFAFDIPTVWNALPDEICASRLSSLFQKAAQNLPVHQGIPTLVLLAPWRSLWCLALFCPWIMKLVDCFWFYCALEFHLNGEIKHYKSPIRLVFCRVRM